MEEGFDFLRGRFSDGEILSFIELSILYLDGGGADEMCKSTPSELG